MTDTSKEDGVLPQLTLASENTPLGAMQRAFLAEARSPSDNRYDATVDLAAMRDMRQVIENRLKSPAQYLAPGATDAIGIFTAPNQFPELANYPKGIPADVDQMVNIANDARDHRQAVYWQHVQNAITAASESINSPVAGFPNATAWLQTPAHGQASLGSHFHLLGDVGGNTFFSTVPQSHSSGHPHHTAREPDPLAGKTLVERARHHAAQARANAARNPVPAHMKLYDTIVKQNPQIPSIAPIPGRAGQRKAPLSPRAGTGDAAGLPGMSRPQGAAASLTTGSSTGQGAALTGYRKVIADAPVQAAAARARREAGRTAMGLVALGGDLSSRSFAPVGGGGAAGHLASHATPGGAAGRLAGHATPGGEVDQDQLAASPFPSHTAADALYPRPQPNANETADSALPGPQHAPDGLPPHALEQALNDYFFRQSRLPPNGGAAFNPYLSPLWAGLKLPG